MKKISILLILGSIFFTDNLFAQQVEVGQGTGPSLYSPISRRADYSAYEIIYLSSDIGLSGYISKLAFERLDGSNVDPIDSVTIYMKHSTQTSLTDTAFTTANFMLVYTGQFPNDSGAGWREVVLDAPFSYNGTENLVVLTVKGYQAMLANTPVAPRWLYTNISPDPDRARRYYGANPITAATSMQSINFSANARLDFGTVGISEIRSHQMQLFPNPVSGILTLTAPATNGTAMLKVYDKSGRLVIQRDLASSHGNIYETIDTENLSEGIYLIRIIGTSESFSSKFVVQK